MLHHIFKRKSQDTPPEEMLFYPNYVWCFITFSFLKLRKYSIINGKWYYIFESILFSRQRIWKCLILQSQKIKLYDLLCIFLRGWVREFSARAHRKSTGEYYPSQARSFSARSFSSMLNKWLIQNLSYVQTWRRNDWYKTFPLTWSPSGRTSSFAMAICHHVIKKSNEKRILLKGKQLFSSRSHPKRSPTQNHFHQDRPHRKMIDKSNAKRIFLNENSHFHQDRPHRKVSKKVQRKTRFT